MGHIPPGQVFYNSAYSVLPKFLCLSPSQHTCSHTISTTTLVPNDQLYAILLHNPAYHLHLSLGAYWAIFSQS